MKVFKFLLGALFGALLCLSSAKYSNIQNVINNIDSPVKITKWKAIGPISIDSMVLPEKYNPFDSIEPYIDEKKINILSKKKNYKEFNIVMEKEFIDFAKYEEKQQTLKKEQEIIKTCIYYAYCEVISNVDQKVSFLIGNDNRIAVWINNKQELKLSENNTIALYTNTLLVDLKKGVNTVLVKYVYNTKTANENQRKFLMDICSVDYSNKEYFNTNKTKFLTNSELTEADTLQFKYGFYFNKGNSLKIVDSENNIIAQKTFPGTIKPTFPLKDIKIGLYECQVYTDNFLFKQSFVVGNSDTLYRKIKDKISKITKLTTEDTINIGALSVRINHLLRFRAHKGQKKFNFDILTSTDSINWQKVYSGQSTATSISKGAIPLKKTLKYLKLVSHGGSINTWLSVCEIDFKPKFTENEKKSFILSTSDKSSTSKLGNIFDGNIATIWETANEDEWLIINTQKIHNIDTIKIAFKKATSNNVAIFRWQQNLVWLLWDLNKIYNDLSKRNNAFYLKPERHIRGYISPIDNQVQYYFINLPDTIDKFRKYPLIIEMQTVRTVRYPFLKSVYMADMDKASKTYSLLNKYGYIYLYVPARNNDFGLNYSAITELEAAISSVKADYNIDTCKLFVWGPCSGGQKAIELSEFFPDKFAAIGSLALTYQDSSSSPNRYDITSLLQNISHVPSFFIHSKYDEHSQIKYTYNILDGLKKLNAKPQSIIYEDLTHDMYVDNYYLFLDFFKDKRIEQYPSKIDFSTYEIKFGRCNWIRINSMNVLEKAQIQASINNNEVNVNCKFVYDFEIIKNKLPFNPGKPLKVTVNGQLKYSGMFDKSTLLIVAERKPAEYQNKSLKNSSIEGPISHAFASPFIIVEGTMGTKPEKEKNKSIAEQLSKLYSEANTAVCPRKFDKDVTDDDIKNKNLILIGTPGSNSIFSKISKNLPITIRPTKILLGDLPVEGTNLEIQLIYPNPLNINKYVVLFTYNNLNKYKLFNIPFETSNYDCIIINNSNYGIFKGNFNLAWE